MPYHMDLSRLPLSYLKERIANDDLIPSFLPLRTGIEEKFGTFSDLGLKTLADMLASLKTNQQTEQLAKKSGIDMVYLTLLSRFVRGMLPKPHPLSEAPRCDERLIEALYSKGIKTTKDLFEIYEQVPKRKALSAELKTFAKELGELAALCDLCRIQWVNPVFARILYEAGFLSAEIVAASLPDEVYKRVVEANETQQLYKGKVGLRDMGRLVALAKVVDTYLR